MTDNLGYVIDWKSCSPRCLRPIRAHIDMHCQACGYDNEPTAKFCGQCGADLAQQAAAASMLGSTILGRYTIRRVIATGGMGVVYEAEQALGDHSRTVAIKVLLPELSHDRTVLSRFSRECGIVAQLSHQNTVRVYDFGSTEDGTLFITMEYVRGESLAEAVGKGPLAVSRALSIIEQMCHALHEAHELGIVHRDLKPDNVMLTRLGDQLDFVKILDFGIAVRVSVGGRHETKLTQKGMILGTPPYMSPEQFTGAVIKRQSDIYSLGIILYELLTGHLPFEADSPWAWAQRHLTVTPPELPSTMPPAIVSTVRAALAKEPALRPATTLDFLNRLYARDQTVPDRAPAASDARAALVVDTQLAPEPVANVTARAVPAHHEVAPPNGLPVTEPTVAPHALPSVVEPKVWAPGVSPAVSYHRARSRRRWLAVVITLLTLGATAFAVWLAYWYELIDIPFDAESLPPPLPVGLGPAKPAASASSVPTGDWSAAPMITPPKLDRATPLPPRTGWPPKTPPSAIPPADSSGPAASETLPAPTSIPWPTSWPSLPSSLPSLPTSLPSLPSAILGVPIPTIFQMGPAPAASANPAPTSSGTLR